MNTLCVELLEKIFSYVDETDKRSLMCINKKFFSILLKTNKKHKMLPIAQRHSDQLRRRNDDLVNKQYVDDYRVDQIVATKDICRYAAERGYLECLKYAHENGCPWDKNICAVAAKNGHLDCLKYAHENGCCPWNKNVCAEAARNGHLDCLKYAHENGCPWDKWTCVSAAENGHLDCLTYAHDNGCEWDEDTCFIAAVYNNFECLKYSRENGMSI